MSTLQSLMLKSDSPIQGLLGGCYPIFVALRGLSFWDFGSPLNSSEYPCSKGWSNSDNFICDQTLRILCYSVIDKLLFYTTK